MSRNTPWYAPLFSARVFGQITLSPFLPGLNYLGNWSNCSNSFEWLFSVLFGEPLWAFSHILPFFVCFFLKKNLHCLKNNYAAANKWFPLKSTGSALMQRVVVSAQSFTALKAFTLYTLSAWRTKQGAHAKLITHQEVEEGEGRHWIIDPQFVFCEFWNNFMDVCFGFLSCLFFSKVESLWTKVLLTKPSETMARAALW